MPGEETTSVAPALELTGVVKTFGAIRSVDGVDLTVATPGVVGLLGANGAGKTSLLNCIAGRYKIDSGRIRLAGRDITRLAPEKRARAGIARTFQIPRPLAGLSAEEVVVVPILNRGGHRSMRDAIKEARAILDTVSFDKGYTSDVSDLSTSSLRRLELARALGSRPSILLLDEICAGSTEREVENLAQAVLDVARQGVTIIMVEHILDAIQAVCDRLVLLDGGKVVLDGALADVLDDPSFASMYLGIEAV